VIGPFGSTGTPVPYPKLLHSSSHGEPLNGSLQVHGIIARPIRTEFSSPVWRELTLYNIAPTVARHPKPELKVHAIQHFINGSAVRGVEYPVIFSDPAWQFPCAKGDSYKIRIWYRYTLLAAETSLSSPGRFCWYLPLTKITNGSKRHFGTTLESANFTMRFANVDYSPNFNHLLQTYNITVAGQIGWTLKDGSNGPHKISTADGWQRVWNAEGRLRWSAPTTHPFLYYIDISYGYEYCRLQLVYKIAGRTAQAVAEYRPPNDGTYHTSSVATDIGTVYHAPAGVFNQGGTQNFVKVPWVTDDTQQSGFSDGNTDLFELIDTALPTSITLSRTTL
jgi:hypothetical protein